MAAASSNGTAFSLAYSFAGSSGNNGNVVSVTNNITATRSQTFTYDALNRLATAQTATCGANCWGLKYGYDVWGNLLTASVTQGSAPTLSVSVNGNNQINGYTYDAAGNITKDGIPHNYAYDAEDRITTVDSGSTATYSYNALGQRVEKAISGGATNYVYGTDGAVLAEYNSSGSLVNSYVYFGGQRIARRDASGNVTYYYADALGSSRIITNSTGTVCYDSDYYPFGAENNFVSNGCPSNWTAQSYKFTGQERDSETGNDHYWARYFGVTESRWLSPDPMGGDPTNPQSLNRYAYVTNNPTSASDPLGLDCHQWGTCAQQGSSHPVSCTNMQCAWQFYSGTMPAFFGGNVQLTCYSDGAPVSCASAFMSLQNGSAYLCLNASCTVRLNGNTVQQWVPPHGPEDDLTPGSWDDVATMAAPDFTQWNRNQSSIQAAPPPAPKDNRPGCFSVFWNNFFPSPVNGEAAGQAAAAASTSATVKSWYVGASRLLVVPLRSPYVRLWANVSTAFGLAADLLPVALLAAEVLPAEVTAIQANRAGQCHPDVAPR